ncbi:MAG: response regulator transcription factor [Verrucomicrobiota bacterium]
MAKQIQVLIIEDNKPYAYSLREMLDAVEDMKWLGTFSRGEEAVDALKTDPSLKPDIILLDLKLSGREGMTFIPVLKQLLPNTQIIVLTQNDNYLKTLEAIRLGVSGYILKNVSVMEIWNIIREVHQGGNIIDPRLSRIVLNVLTSKQTKVENPLSDREQQVLEQLAMGHVKKEIADHLGLSLHTINRYTENLYKKLQVSNVAAAVATAIRKGII